MILKGLFMGMLQITLSLIWVGIITGISFIATPLRFRAPGINTKLGVSITRLVVGVVSKLELLFCAILLASFIFIPPPKFVGAFRRNKDSGRQSDNQTQPKQSKNKAKTKKTAG